MSRSCTLCSSSDLGRCSGHRSAARRRGWHVPELPVLSPGPFARSPWLSGEHGRACLAASARSRGCGRTRLLPRWARAIGKPCEEGFNAFLGPLLRASPAAVGGREAFRLLIMKFYCSLEGLLANHNTPAHAHKSVAESPGFPLLPRAKPEQSCGSAGSTEAKPTPPSAA